MELKDSVRQPGSGQAQATNPFNGIERLADFVNYARRRASGIHSMELKVDRIARSLEELVDVVRIHSMELKDVIAYLITVYEEKA